MAQALRVQSGEADLYVRGAQAPVVPPPVLPLPVLSSVGIGDFLFLAVFLSVAARYSMQASKAMWATLVVMLVALSTLPWLWRQPASPVRSALLASLLLFCTGGVLALQIYLGGNRFGAEAIVPQVVVLGITRELGPVIAGLMVAGRVAAAIAAEIGTMKVTERTPSSSNAS